MHHYILGEYLPGLSSVIFNNIWQIVLTKIVIDPHYVLEKSNTIQVLSNVKFEWSKFNDQMNNCESTLKSKNIIIDENL